MQKFAVIWMFGRTLRQTSPQSKRLQGQAGFTLIELLVVVVLVGVLAAIASPSWLGFVQQRRASAANDSVYRALQEAQSLAKTRKLSYSVSFRNQNEVPQVAVHPETSPPDKYWKQLGEQLSLKPGQIVLRTNLDNPNQANAATAATIAENETKRITFNYLGNLPMGADLDAGGGKEGLVIEVGAPPGQDMEKIIPSTRRCVKVRTLLGSLQPGKRAECELS